MATLEPLEVEIRSNDIRVPLNRIAAGAGTEVVFVGIQSGAVETPGFRLLLPGEVVCARPVRESKEEYVRRKNRWQAVNRGLLLGSRTNQPLVGGLPEGLLEEGQCLWLVDVRLGAQLLGRLGLVGRPDRAEIAGRLERLNLLAELDLWRRVGDVWEHHLDLAWRPVDGHDPESVFGQRLDLLAREVRRATGVDGVGIHVWREDLAGYLLVGYHGPGMPRPGPGGPPTDRSSWWFHRAGDPSLVHSVFPAERGGNPRGPLIWPGSKITPNAPALAEFERQHPGAPIASAVAAPLELREYSLRGVVAAFVTGEEGGTLSSLYQNWQRVHRSGDALPPSGRARLQAQAILAARFYFQRAVEERLQRLLRRALAPARAADSKARDPEEEAEALLGALRQLAGAWSGALWEVDWPRRRRRPLSLLHPLPGEPPGWQTLERKIPRRVVTERRPVLVQRRKEGSRWIAEVDGKDRPLAEASSTARWLEHFAPPDVVSSYSLSVPLARAGECHAVLTLSWWFPPPGLDPEHPSVERLVKGLGAAVEAAAVHTGTLVAWRRERERNRLSAQLTILVDREVHRGVGAIRAAFGSSDVAPPPGAALDELSRFVQRVCTEAEKLFGRQGLRFYRLEDWVNVEGSPLRSERPLVRQLAPPPEPEDDGLRKLDEDLRDELLNAADKSYSKGEIHVVEALLPLEEGRQRQAIAFPSVVGEELLGLLLVPGRPVDIEPEQGLWLGLATALGRELELLRRQLYRFLDELADRELLASMEALAPGENRAGAVARTGVGLARRVAGARWAAVLSRDADGRLEILATAGIPHAVAGDLAAALRGESERWQPRDWGRCLPPFGGGERTTDEDTATCAVFAAPLATGGLLHGWLAAGASGSWSRDGTRLVKAVARRLAPALATAVSADRVYLAMSRLQHGVRSAWQEVATGISAVRGRLSELGMVRGELAEGLEQAEAGLRRARARMSTLLYFSTSGLTANQGSRSHTDLLELVRRTAKAYRFAASDRDVELHLVLPLVPVEVDGTPELVALIVENLVENAVKYAARGTRVTVAVDLRGAVAVLRVIDTGRPFPVERKADLERPFTRAASSGEGFGVGLSVVLDCCRRLGADWEPFSRPLTRSRDRKSLLHRVEMRVTMPLAGKRRVL